MEKIQKSILTFAFSEPNGRIKGIVQNNHHISMVPAQLCYPLLEQEGLTGGQDNVLPPPRLLPRVWRWVSRRLSKAKKGKLLKVSTGRVQAGYVQYFNKSLEQILTNVVNGSFLWDIWITFNSVKLICRNISRPRHLPPVDWLFELKVRRRGIHGCRSEAGPCRGSSVYPERIPGKQSRPGSASVQPLHLCNRSAVARWVPGTLQLLEWYLVPGTWQLLDW